MIPDEKLIKRADAFVKAHEDDDDLNPDFASAMVTYRAQRDQGSELGSQVHARALLRRAEGLGYDTDPTPAKKTAVKKSPAKKTAKTAVKKSPAKKTAKKS